MLCLDERCRSIVESRKNVYERESKEVSLYESLMTKKTFEMRSECVQNAFYTLSAS